MAYNERDSEDARHCLETGDAMVSEDKGSEDYLLKTQSHNAAFNGAFFANKPSSAYHPPLSVTTACDHAQRIIHDQRFSNQDSKRDSGVAIKTPAPTLDLSKTIFTMPPTPPQTPRKGSQDTNFQRTPAGRSKIRRWQRFPVVCPDQPLASTLQQIRSQNKIHWKKYGPAPESYEEKVERWLNILRLEAEDSADDGDSNVKDVDPQLIPNPQLGVPCTHNSLDHLLDCGHTVVTVKPDLCVSNCHVRSSPEFIQLRDLDIQYMCIVCIVNDLQVPHDAKYRGLTEVVIRAASGPGKTPDWLEKNLDLIAEGYRDEALRELKRFANDKFCIPVSWIEHHWQHLVDEIVQERVQAKELLEEVSRAPLPLSKPPRRQSLETSIPTTALSKPTLPSSQTWPLSQPSNPTQNEFFGRENRDTVQLWGNISNAANLESESDPKTTETVSPSVPKLPRDPIQRETVHLWNNINATDTASIPSLTSMTNPKPAEEDVAPSIPKLQREGVQRETVDLWNNINCTDTASIPSLTSDQSAADDDTQSVAMPPTPSSVYSRSVAEYDGQKTEFHSAFNTESKPCQESMDLFFEEQQTLSPQREKSK